MKIPCNDSKITSAVWGPLGECIIAGHESGELNQYSAKSGEVLVNVKEHSRQINDIQLSRDMTMFVTASKDNTAKVSKGKGSGRAALTLLLSSQFA